MTALRFRGIRYWWAGIGISVLAFLYVGPIAAALRQPSFVGSTTPLAALTVPNAALPLLRVPKVHRLAPLPPLHAAKAARATPGASPTVVRHRVPVVTDSYSLVGTATGIARTNTPVDLFQSTPAVSDTVGTVVQLPAVKAPAAAPPAPAPAAPADTSTPATQTPGGDATPASSTASDQPRFLAVEDNPAPAPADASAGTQISSSGTSTITSPQTGAVSAGTSGAITAAISPPVETAVVGGSGSSSVSLPSGSTTSTVTTSTTSTSTGADGSSSVTAPVTTSATEPTGTQLSSSSQSGQPGNGPGAGSSTGIAGVTGTGSCDSAGSGVASTPATQTDGATTAPAGTDCTTPDPNANTASGVSPPPAPATDLPAAAPASLTLTASGSGAHTISAAFDGTNVVVTIDGIAQSVSPASLASLTVVGGDGNDSFTIDASLASAGIPVTFDGGSGADTLYGPAVDSTWSITGAGSGSVGGVAFTGFENLTGAAGNKDSFDFAASGSLTGMVEGGAGGYDVVALVSDGSAVVSTITGPQSGTIARGDNVVTYAGMEPVAVSGTNNVTITANTDSLTINVTDDSTPADGAFTVDPSPSGEATLVTSAVAGPVDLTINLHGGRTRSTFMDGHRVHRDDSSQRRLWRRYVRPPRSRRLHRDDHDRRGRRAERISWATTSARCPAQHQPADRLDFTNNTGTISYDGSAFTD